MTMDYDMNTTSSGQGAKTTARMVPVVYDTHCDLMRSLDVGCCDDPPAHDLIRRSVTPVKVDATMQPSSNLLLGNSTS